MRRSAQKPPAQYAAEAGAAGERLGTQSCTLSPHLMRSWRLTAEIRGGRWNSAPVSVSMARATLAAPPSTCKQA